MAISKVLRSMGEAPGNSMSASGEEQILAAARLSKDEIFDPMRPLVNSNINEA